MGRTTVHLALRVITGRIKWEHLSQEQFRRLGWEEGWYSDQPDPDGLLDRCESIILNAMGLGSEDDEQN